MEKIKKKRKISRAISCRGGMGKLTVPQKMLARALNLPMEVVVLTNGHKTNYKKVRPFYCVDIVDLKTKTAIEVDGESHACLKRKKSDLKKDEILEAVGWSVLRFKNKRVLYDLAGVVRDVMSHVFEKRKNCDKN